MYKGSLFNIFLELSLCHRTGIEKSANDTVTHTIYEKDSNATICEVYAVTGTLNGIKVRDCIAYCKGYGLWCVGAYEDNSSDCSKQMDTPRTCGYGFTQAGFVTKDIICSCGKKYRM